MSDDCSTEVEPDMGHILLSFPSGTRRRVRKSGPDSPKQGYSQMNLGMMQKFGYTPCRRDQPNIPVSGMSSFASAYAKKRLDEMRMFQSVEKVKAEQPRAYYYQMVPDPCLESEEFGSRHAPEISSGATRLNNFVESPFCRDSCSDADSGICTDNGSECQQSPKCSTTGSFSPTISTAAACRREIRKLGNVGCPPPPLSILPVPSSFKLRGQSPSKKSNADSGVQGSPNAQSLCTRRGKQPMKVRFADEVASAESFARSDTSAAVAPRSQSSSAAPSASSEIASNSSSHYYSTPPPISNFRPSRRESPPPLPDYEMAVRRMREIGRHAPRSRSLPRRSDQCRNESIIEYDQPKNGDYEANVFQFETHTQTIRTKTSTLPRLATAVAVEKRLAEAKSMENLAMDEMIRTQRPSENLTPSKSCENLNQQNGHQRLTSTSSNPISARNDYLIPDARQNYGQSRNRPRFSNYMSSALQKIADNALQKNDQKMPEVLGSNRSSPVIKHQWNTVALPLSKTAALVKQANFKTLPVNCFPNSEAELAKFHNEGEPLCTDRLIESRLIGLDHQGVQLVELRKRDNGPFGFYIATGSFKKKKGIFVSRITVRGLFPLLSVGDQILDVDFQSVKGRTLEEVQHMMTNTDRVVLRTLPAIMR